MAVFVAGSSLFADVHPLLAQADSLMTRRALPDTSNRPPAYPDTLLRFGIEGAVLTQFVVGAGRYGGAPGTALSAHLHHDD